MPNWCFSSYVLEGSEQEIKELDKTVCLWNTLTIKLINLRTTMPKYSFPGRAE